MSNFEVDRKNLGYPFCFVAGVVWKTVRLLLSGFWSSLKESQGPFVSGFWSNVKKSRGSFVFRVWSRLKECSRSLLFGIWSNLKESRIHLFCCGSGLESQRLHVSGFCSSLKKAREFLVSNFKVDWTNVEYPVCFVVGVVWTTFGDSFCLIF